MGVSWLCQNQRQGPELVLLRCTHRQRCRQGLLQAGKGTALHCWQEPARRRLMPRVALLWVSPAFAGWCDSLSPPRLPAGRGHTGLMGRASHAAPGVR